MNPGQTQNWLWTNPKSAVTMQTTSWKTNCCLPLWIWKNKKFTLNSKISGFWSSNIQIGLKKTAIFNRCGFDEGIHWFPVADSCKKNMCFQKSYQLYVLGYNLIQYSLGYPLSISKHCNDYIYCKRTKHLSRDKNSHVWSLKSAILPQAVSQVRI